MTRISDTAVLEAKHGTVTYGGKPAIRDVSITFTESQITAIMGPIGSGKSTLLRAFNRLNDVLPGMRTTGSFTYRSRDLYARDVDPGEVRRRIGMVFREPTPFPRSIEGNVAWGAMVNGLVGRDEIRALVERSLTRAGLWQEVKNRLHASPAVLTSGEQQRLCIARALAMKPDVLLLDEPCATLDPASSSRIEDLLYELKASCTIVIAAHTMQQAARVSDHTALLFEGELIEVGATKTIFTRPRDKRTEDYVTGRFD
ncbi:MAG: phosphate ABC transporter ATP-binding protein [Clostridia bacterium]|nr:phosphate ABC transporter ATP-binding protein [Deltaproteobacteria bacterium]